MDSHQIANVLNIFAEYPRAFTFEELSDFTDSDINREELRHSLITDSRFIRLRQGTSSEEHFIPERTLLLWFSSLSVRLAKAKQARLGEHQVATLMSSLRVDGRWDVPPPETIQFGCRLGFIGHAWTSSQYVFPIARILSFMSSSAAKVTTTMLESFTEMQERGLSSEQLLQGVVQEGLSRFSPKARYIIQGREGLLNGTKMTLEQIGANLGLSRARIQQIESKLWRRIRHIQNRRPFIVALLYEVMGKQGSLIAPIDSPKASLRRFIAKCVSIPQVEVPHSELLIIGASPNEVTALESPGRFPDKIDAKIIATRLESEGKLCLIDSDLRILAERVAQFRRKNLNKAQRVYLTLRNIGKPAHYAEITEVHNSLFPDHLSTEHNIHAVLSREKYGVVWIGAKGTFALKERGYDRPAKKMFDAVTEIVEKVYTRTGRPVPFGIIAAEIGKYRQVVAPASLTIAAHCNPSLQRVYRDCFVPKDPADQTQDEISGEELDRILREFEKRN